MASSLMGCTPPNLTAQQVKKLISGLDKTLKDVTSSHTSGRLADLVRSLTKCKPVMSMLSAHLKSDFFKTPPAPPDVKQATSSGFCNTSLLASLIQILHLLEPAQRGCNKTTSDVLWACAQPLWWAVFWLSKDYVEHSAQLDKVLTDAMTGGLLQVLYRLDTGQVTGFHGRATWTGMSRSSTGALFHALKLCGRVSLVEPEFATLVRAMQEVGYLQHCCKRLMETLESDKAGSCQHAEDVLVMMHKLCLWYGRVAAAATDAYVPQLCNNKDVEAFLRTLLLSLLRMDQPGGPAAEIDFKYLYINGEEALEMVARYKAMAVSTLELLSTLHRKWRSCPDTFSQCLTLRRSLGLMAMWPIQRKIEVWLHSLPPATQPQASEALLEVILQQLNELPPAIQELRKLHEASSSSSSTISPRATGSGSSDGSSSRSVVLSPGTQLAIKHNYLTHIKSSSGRDDARPWVSPGVSSTMLPANDALAVLHALLADPYAHKLIIDTHAHRFLAALEAIVRRVPLYDKLHGNVANYVGGFVMEAVNILSPVLINRPEGVVMIESIIVSLRKFILHWAKMTQSVTGDTLRALIKEVRAMAAEPVVLIHRRDTYWPTCKEVFSPGAVLALERLHAVMDAFAAANWNVTDFGQLEDPNAVNTLFQAAKSVPSDHVTPSVGCWNPSCSNLDGNSEAELKLLKCSGCKVARYCCRECQSEDWKAHKLSCKQ